MKTQAMMMNKTELANLYGYTRFTSLRKHFMRCQNFVKDISKIELNSFTSKSYKRIIMPVELEVIERHFGSAIHHRRSLQKRYKHDQMGYPNPNKLSSI